LRDVLERHRGQPNTQDRPRPARAPAAAASGRRRWDMLGAMLRRWVVVTMLLVCACGGNPPPAQHAPQPRPTVARRELPPELAPLVPTHGVLATGGGVKSPLYRIVVDTDAKTIYTGTAPANTTLGAKLADERTRELTPRNEQHLMQLCSDAWQETPPATPPDRVEGYDEFLIIADGEEVFLLEGHGPITRPAAARAIEALRAAAAL
jgi:hypothetical protein